jgi:hypothetical protein
MSYRRLGISRMRRMAEPSRREVGMGWLLYLLLHNLFRWPIPTIIGACGVVAAGVTITAMAFEDYPFHHERPGLARLGLVMNSLGMAFLSFFVLRVIGQQVTTFKTVPVELWVGISALNFIAPMVIFLYAIWGRWPLPPPAPAGPGRRAGHRPAGRAAAGSQRPASRRDARRARHGATSHARDIGAPGGLVLSGGRPCRGRYRSKG